MKFEEVIPAYREGKKIRCKSWGKGMVFSHESISSEEFLAEDWEIEEEPRSTKFAKIVYYIATNDVIMEAIENSEFHKKMKDHPKLYRRIYGMDQEVEIEE